MLIIWVRVGSLHGCIYIVNDELKVRDLKYEKDPAGKLKFKNITISFSKQFGSLLFSIDDKPVVSKNGLVVGPEYENWVRN